MKVISTHPCPLAVRLTPDGWQILTPPGSMAELLSQLAQVSQLQSTLVDGQTMVIIPLTRDLDSALESLINTLINLRYDTGRVQLELFSEEAV